MDKRVAMGITVAAMLLAVFAVTVVLTEWDEFKDKDDAYRFNESPGSIDFTGEVDVVTGDMDMNSLNGALFETYGPLLLILALLMFGAMIGGVCIAREEVEKDDTH